MKWRYNNNGAKYWEWSIWLTILGLMTCTVKVTSALRPQSVSKINTIIILLYRLRMKDVFNNKCPLVLRDEGSTDSVKNNR